MQHNIIGKQRLQIICILIEVGILKRQEGGNLELQRLHKGWNASNQHECAGGRRRS